MDKFNPRRLFTALGVSALTASSAQELPKTDTTPLPVKMEVSSVESKKTEPIYLTRDGNVRYYRNPSAGKTEHGDEKISYSYGATQSPYASLEEIKLKTKTPENLTETDFFTNYINARDQTKKVLIDKNTGNTYYDYTEYDPSLNQVKIAGEFHWNIHRFLIQPHYLDFNIPIPKARLNALHDMYKYFLYLEKGDTEKAWAETNRFITEEVDAVVNSAYANWARENYPKLGLFGPKNEDTTLSKDRYIGDSNLFSSHDKTTLVSVILDYNENVLSGKSKGHAYIRKEIEDILIDYNIVYRKKDLETAKQIARDVIDAEFERDILSEEKIKNKPLSSGMPAQLPPDFNAWNSENQNDWINSHPDQMGQAPFTENDKQKQISFYENRKQYRKFLDSSK